jgi:methionyl-tRNA formyltransferase
MSTSTRYGLACSKLWIEDLAERLQHRVGCEFVLFQKKSELTPEALRQHGIETVFFPHWSFILPRDIYDSFECVMFHMTDLPYGRGGSPLQNLIVRGHRETKISCFRCDGGIDTGPIYFKEPLSLEGSAKEIFRRATERIESMIVRWITERPTPVAQQGEPVAFQRRTPEQSDLSPVTSVEQAFDMIRMLDADGYPHAFIDTGSLRIEFRDARIEADGSVSARARLVLR